MKTTTNIITLLIILAVAITVTGCAGLAESVIDPQGRTQRVQAQEKTKQDEAFAQHQQWLAQGKQADADKADADARARAAEAGAQADTAEAQADQARSKAFADLGEAIKDAGQNNTPVVVAIIAILLIAGWAVWNANQTTVAVAQSNGQPRLLPSPPAAQIVPPAVQRIADHHGLTPVHNGHIWTLQDEHGNIVQRQRLITSK